MVTAVWLMGIGYQPGWERAVGRFHGGVAMVDADDDWITHLTGLHFKVEFSEQFLPALDLFHGGIQPRCLTLELPLDMLELLSVVAAVDNDVHHAALAIGGRKDLALSRLVSEGRHELLTQPFAIAPLEGTVILSNAVLFQNV